MGRFAWRWQRMLDEGTYATISEIGDAETISKSYVSRILQLALPAPDIGRRTSTLTDLLKPLPAEWRRQREQH